MANFYFISPIGTKSDFLFDTFLKTFTENGHHIVDDESIRDVLFVDLYSYQKKIDLSYNLGGNMVLFDFSDRGGMSKEPDPNWSLGIYGLTKKIVYFMRKMDKTKTYPSYVYPIEHIMEYEFPLASKDDLANSEYDVCFVGNESPQRRNTVKGLIDAGIKVDVHWTSERGKLSHEEWIERHYNAKFFLESDGGGFGSERPFKLMSVAPMLRQRNNMLRNNDWFEYTECVPVDEHPTAYDIEQLKLVLSSSDWVYGIYKRGYDKLKRYFTAEARATYILETLKANNIL